MDVIHRVQELETLAKSLYLSTAKLIGELQGEQAQYELNSSTKLMLIDFENSNTYGGQIEMPRPLTYGQGSIIYRQRTKKTGGIYHWYEARWMDDYGHQRTKTFHTKEDARNALLQLKQHTTRRPRKQNTRLFGAFIQQYFDVYRKDKVTVSTAKRYQRMIDVLPKAIADTPLSVLEDLPIQKHLNQIKSVKERFETKKFLASCLKHAFNTGKTKTNIGAMLNVEQYVAKPREILPREKEAEFISLISPTYRNHIIGYLYTGCRLSELMRITEEDVDRENDTITIKGANKGRGATHEFRLRKIPLLPQIKPIKFPLPSISKKWFWANIRDACAKLGIKITPHDLRHTFATRCREAEIEIKTFSQWLGHKNVSITMDLYAAHTTTEQFKRQAEKLEKSTSTLISTLISTEKCTDEPDKTE